MATTAPIAATTAALMAATTTAPMAAATTTAPMAATTTAPMATMMAPMAMKAPKGSKVPRFSTISTLRNERNEFFKDSRFRDFLDQQGKVLDPFCPGNQLLDDDDHSMMRQKTPMKMIEKMLFAIEKETNAYISEQIKKPKGQRAYSAAATAAGGRKKPFRLYFHNTTIITVGPVFPIGDRLSDSHIIFYRDPKFPTRTTSAPSYLITGSNLIPSQVGKQVSEQVAIIDLIVSTTKIMLVTAPGGGYIINLQIPFSVTAFDMVRNNFVLKLVDTKYDRIPTGENIGIRTIPNDVQVYFTETGSTIALPSDQPLYVTIKSPTHPLEYTVGDCVCSLKVQPFDGTPFGTNTPRDSPLRGDTHIDEQVYNRNTEEVTRMKLPSYSFEQYRTKSIRSLEEQEDVKKFELIKDADVDEFNIPSPPPPTSSTSSEKKRPAPIVWIYDDTTPPPRPVKRRITFTSPSPSPSPSPLVSVDRESWIRRIDDATPNTNSIDNDTSSNALRKALLIAISNTNYAMNNNDTRYTNSLRTRLMSITPNSNQIDNATPRTNPMIDNATSNTTPIIVNATPRTINAVTPRTINATSNSNPTVDNRSTTGRQDPGSLLSRINIQNYYPGSNSNPTIDNATPRTMNAATPRTMNATGRQHDNRSTTGRHRSTTRHQDTMNRRDYENSMMDNATSNTTSNNNARPSTNQDPTGTRSRSRSNRNQIVDTRPNTRANYNTRYTNALQNAPRYTNALLSADNATSNSNSNPIIDNATPRTTNTATPRTTNVSTPRTTSAASNSNYSNYSNSMNDNATSTTTPINNARPITNHYIFIDEDEDEDEDND